MKKLEKFSLGKRLSAREQKVVLGGVMLPKHPCKCTCIHANEPFIWITYVSPNSNCSTITHSEYCGGDEYSNTSCSNY